jgi:REP element-mobilizing transposase RayT
MPDHVHMMISIPPKYAVSQVVGFIKGKSAIDLARTYGERMRNFVAQSFWAWSNSICGVDCRLHAAPATGAALATPSAASSGPIC